jgi:predicted nucleotidyltransferase
MKRNAVREVVGRFRTANPRVFGSVLHGTDRDGSDIDLLVDALPVQHCLIWAACKTSWNRCSASTSIC